MQAPGEVVILDQREMLEQPAQRDGRGLEPLPQAVRDLGWKAQLRLTGRFARLRARGVHINKVCVAVARELAGFVWAIAWTAAKLAQT